MNGPRLAAPWTILSAALLLTTAGSLAAQNGVLIGTVTDSETGVAVVGAQVTLLGGDEGGDQTGGVQRAALTDDAGRFRLQVAAGTYALTIQRIAYVKTRFDDVVVQPGQTATQAFALTSDAVSLDGLIISANRTPVGEKATETPATTHSVTSLEILERPAINLADHLGTAPGVDVISTGVQSTNVVVRGFNNIFSGALHMLTDHRLAGVPSLRVNLMHFIPSTDEDIERMEVVLGPGSALYGPNTANGVVHILTKSPLDDQGTTVTLGAGEQSLFQGAFRSAFLLTDDFGFKISGQYTSGNDWAYVDPTEQAAKDAAAADPTACMRDRSVRGLNASEGAAACGRLGVRNFDIERWGVEARADYRFADDGTVVGTYGRNTSSGIELTGLGAAQARDWTYEFFQGRVSKGRSFAQAYYNTNDAGGSYLLRDGVPLVDQSTLFVAQGQQGFEVANGRQELTFGVDYFATRPESQATIYGSFDDDDNIDEWGVYAQSKTALHEKLDLIVAGRLDSHSVLPDNVWSPRAALVFKPREGQNVRFSYNRAFSTPSALNYFLDISGGVAPPPLGQLGYSTRAFGSGRNGWSLQNADGTLHGMRSPFNPAGADQLLPADVAVLWQLALGVLRAQGAIDAATAAFLGQLSPTNSDIARLLLDPGTGKIAPLAGTRLADIPPITEAYTETFELGWTALLGQRVRVTADAYYMKKNDFVSPLVVETPLLLLSGADLAAYLTPIVGGATAAQLAAGIAQIPLGVVSSNQVGARGADLIVSYRNVGDIDLWGADLGFRAFLNDEWTLDGSYSHVSEDYFQVEGGSTVALNAPKDKGSLSLAYRDVATGLNASGRVRFSSSFPAESAGFAGTSCITGGTGGIFEEDCVDSFTIVDLNTGYKVPNTAATIQVAVNNVFNTGYRSFVGVPTMGRMGMVRVKYDLF